MAACAGAYTGTVTALARRLPERLLPWPTVSERRAVLNAVGVSSGVLGLLAVSASTEVRVLGTGDVRSYGWLPAWFCLLAGAMTVGWVLRSLRRHSSGPAPAAEIERRAVTGVSGALLLLLGTAVLPGPLPVLDVFHDGEAVVPPGLVGQGLFPWRDFTFVHGVFHDLVRPALGFWTFEHSVWGVAAVGSLVLKPLHWIGLYVLACRLFRGNVVGLWLVGLLAVTSLESYAHMRLLFWPLVLVALARMLELPTWLRCLAFSGCLLAQSLLVPEATFAAFAGAGVTIAFEAVEWGRGGPMRTAFVRTVRCGAVALVALALSAGFLLVNGAADDFVREMMMLASDHRLKVGIPATWEGAFYALAAFAPVAGIAPTVWYLTVRVLAGRSFEIEDWMLVAAAATG